MADNKEAENIIEIDLDEVPEEGPVDLGYQGGRSDKNNSPSSDELKEVAGEFVKAAGTLAGAFGKLAKKKGADVKAKIEDEEFQEKVSTNIKYVTDKIDTFVSSDSAKGRKVVNVKGGVENYSNQSSREIETTFEVEGKDTVNFETKATPRGMRAALEKAQSAKAEKKAEIAKRKKEEKRRKEEEERKNSIMYFVMALCLIGICLFMANRPQTTDLSSSQEIEDEPPIKYMAVNAEDYPTLKEWDDIKIKGRGCTAPTSFEGNDENEIFPTIYLASLDKDGNISEYGIEAKEVMKPSDDSVKNKFNEFLKMTPEEQSDYVITLQGSFDSLKADKDDWQFNEYLTFELSPEIVGVEKIEKSEEDQKKVEENKVAQNKKRELESLIGATCDKADPKIRELGFSPKYSTYEANNNVITFEVDLEGADLSEWKVDEIEDIDGKEVSVIVISQYMEEQRKEKAKVSSSLSDSEARDIAYKYIQYNMTKTFRLKDIPQFSIMDGGKRMWSLCKFKNDYGDTIEAEVIAQVNAETKEVELVEVRNSTNGLIWSYYK